MIHLKKLVSFYILTCLFSGDLHVRLDTITTTDVLKAIERTRPSASINKEKYILWQKDYESI